MNTPFQFNYCVVQVELTGRRAFTTRDFARLLGEVPNSSIFHHLHHTFLRNHLELPEFTNDFSNWAANELEDRALAEKLANVAPFHFPNVEELRGHLKSVVEDHMRARPQLADITVAPFHFDSGTTLVLTGETVNTLHDFKTALAAIETSAIYYHVYEARLRKHSDSDDFSGWFEDYFDAPELVAAIRGIDPYMHSLEHLRQLILGIIDRWNPLPRQGGLS
jgi:hypothetical protein